MRALPVEWVLVIYYGPSAHRATYGRLNGRDTKYTKDYIQLSRKSDFIETLTKLFPGINDGAGSVGLTYKWPMGTAPGELVFRSADRPHLKWETSLGAPQVWKMALEPSEVTSETIPGDPSHLDFSAAENEFALLASRGAGQPYLVVIKTRDEPRTLHLRAYLTNPSARFAWANIQIAPEEIKALAQQTSQQSALAWSVFQSGGVTPSASIQNALGRILASHDPGSVIDSLGDETGRALRSYLQQPGYGLFFDPARNHNAWLLPPPLPEQIKRSIREHVKMLEERYPTPQSADAAAEMLDVSAEEVTAFREQIGQRNYEVADSSATVKTRGSAQKAFAEAVKSNYGFRCAITGISTKDFLVASHIVPWSEDQSIRLDPSNGICLSSLVDRAFEKGYLLIEDDLTIRINRGKIGEDQVLLNQLEQFDEQKLRTPTQGSPNLDYLRRRRAMVLPTE